MINVKSFQLGFYLSGTKFLFPMGACSEKFYHIASKFCCKIQKTTCGARGCSCRHFTPRNIRHAYVCSTRTKNSLYDIFSLGLTEKCLGNSNCKSWCIALVALLGKKQK